MMYLSTRGQAPAATFETALLSGLAPDGGLYMPASWPSLPSLTPDAGQSYALAAAVVMAAYTDDDLNRGELERLAHEAYAGFDAHKTAPLRDIGNGLFLLELFHGPTLAFKDFAMQMLSRLMSRALAKRGERATILGATSGDTGAAAVEAFRGQPNIDVFILYPHGRVSDVQRKQMTTAAEDNIHVIAVEGTFDDAQAIVKTLLGDQNFRSKHKLCAINSINWARIMAQVVYYYTACASIGGGVPPSFSVPTGNFGDIFAGYAAFRMGLSMGKLIIATNENDILARTLASGVYEPRDVYMTDSPSMDIQVSSNFERLLFEESGRDAGLVRDSMAGLRQEGSFTIPAAVLSRMRDKFSAHRVTAGEAALAARRLFDAKGIIVDPHTAVGLAAAEREAPALDDPIVVLATAHPAKFPDAVEKSVGRSPEVPARLRDFLVRPERFETVANSAAAVAACMKRQTHVDARKDREL